MAHWPRRTCARRLGGPTKTVIAVCTVIATSTACAPDAGPIVTVTGGQVRGVRLDTGGVAFKGIPYAQPPIGELRWREPRPVTPWSGVRDGTAFGPICPQSQSLIPNGRPSPAKIVYT
jgi:hypothetical protein